MEMTTTRITVLKNGENSDQRERDQPLQSRVFLIFKATSMIHDWQAQQKGDQMRF